MSLASSADRQAKFYFGVKELIEEKKVEESKVIEVAAEIEDWGSDFSYYDVYTENPEGFVEENGFVPEIPLNAERRRFFKSKGFNFHRDGSVSWKKIDK